MATSSRGKPPDKNREFSWAEEMEDEINGVFFAISIDKKRESAKADFTKLDLYAVNRAFLPYKSQGLLSLNTSRRSELMLKVSADSKAREFVSQASSIDIGEYTLPIVVREIESLNTSEGTIYAPELDATDLKTVVENETSIKDITRMKVFDKDAKKMVDSHRYKILFASRALPEVIRIAFSQFRVRRFYPSPRSCVKCLSYEHTGRVCKVPNNEALCRKCGYVCGVEETKGDNQEKRFNVLPGHVCNSTPRCAVCKANHRPNSPECEPRKKEMEIIRIKLDHNLSYPEARRRVEAASDSLRRQGVSFAAKVNTQVHQSIESSPNDEENALDRKIAETRKKRIAVEEKNRILEQEISLLDVAIRRNRALLKTLEQKQEIFDELQVKIDLTEDMDVEKSDGEVDESDDFTVVAKKRSSTQLRGSPPQTPANKKTKPETVASDDDVKNLSINFSGIHAGGVPFLKRMPDNAMDIKLVPDRLINRVLAYSADAKTELPIPPKRTSKFLYMCNKGFFTSKEPIEGISTDRT